MKVKTAAENRLEKSALEGLAEKVEMAALLSRARVQIAEEDFEEKLKAIEKGQEVDSLLAELKSRRGGGKD